MSYEIYFCWTYLAHESETLITLAITLSDSFLIHFLSVGLSNEQSSILYWEDSGNRGQTYRVG